MSVSKYIVLIILLFFLSCSKEKETKGRVESSKHKINKEELLSLAKPFQVSLTAKIINGDLFSEMGKLLDRVDNGILYKLKFYISPKYRKGEILSGKGLSESLVAIDGVSHNNAIDIIKNLREHVDFRYLRAGEELLIEFKDDCKSIKKFQYRPNILISHVLTNSDSGLVYSRNSLESEKRLKVYKGELENTLDNSLINAGLKSNLKQAVNGIMECTVNFRYNARNGDTFYVLVEEQSYDGLDLRGGKILYASYEGKKAGKHEAFRYDDNDESSTYTAHYTKDGKALIHSALRYPLDKIHVTSNFGWRVHPVTKRRSFHNGVDYRGRIGTPIYAVATGKVEAVKNNKLSGKHVIIKHPDGTRTYYLHMSSISVRKGQGVSPRQVIGKVGKTGRVSGPHLHFGIKYKGKWVNPLNKRMIATPKLKGKRLDKFKAQMKDILKLKDRIEREG